MMIWRGTVIVGLMLLSQSAMADEPVADEADHAKQDVLRIGMIGLDTSHCLAFTKILNTPDAPGYIPGCRVVAVYPQGSPDIESSVSRVPKYTEQIQAMGVSVVNDLDVMLESVDAVLLETNDGRPHAEQFAAVLKAGKPCFIDKPLAGSLVDCLAIFELAEEYEVPVFSSSSLRFSSGVQAVRNGAVGDVLGCNAWSPCSLEKTHPDLYWYGIHGCEILYTTMGIGCRSVTRSSTDGTDFVTGTWADGRIGTFRGIRGGKSGYGGTAFGSKAVQSVGSYEGYRPLVVEIVRFFRTGQSPVPSAETLELYTFMEAADESKRQGGMPISLEDVINMVRPQVDRRKEELRAMVEGR